MNDVLVRALLNCAGLIALWLTVPLLCLIAWLWWDKLRKKNKEQP